MRAKILVVEPFGGGSHAALIHGWQRNSRHDFTVLDLPAIHWKWRSRHASLTLAERANGLSNSGLEFDIVFCSDMLNVPEWRGFAVEAIRRLPVVIYFHENQFSYPVAEGQSRDYHFAYSNVLSAIASEALWFNSDFHLREFSSASCQWLKRMPDFSHIDLLKAALARAVIVPPGIETQGVRHTDATVIARQRNGASVPVIGWVARWEHDKRPDRFTRLVERLLATELDFKLVLLGQQFVERPASLKRLLQVAGDRVLQCGYVDSADEYRKWLNTMDLVVSTADHEFFGIAIVEAIAAGVMPLLPNRLAYPEVLNVAEFAHHAGCLYNSEDDLFHKAANFLIGETRFSAELESSLRESAERYQWRNLTERYDTLVEQTIEHGGVSVK